MALVSVRYGYVLHLAVSNGPKRDLLSIKGSYRFMVLTQRAQAHTKNPFFFSYSLLANNQLFALTDRLICLWPQLVMSLPVATQILRTTNTVNPCIKHNFLHNNSFIRWNYAGCLIYTLGHSTTTWTKFYPILITHLPRADNCGHFT